MGDEVIEQLQKADWLRIGASLLKFVLMRGGRGPYPGGHTPQDVVCMAISDVCTGNRPWDPKKHSLKSHLEWTVRSILSKKGLFGLKEASLMTFTDDNATLDVEDDRELPAFCNADREMALKSLGEEIRGDRELEDLVEAIKMDCWKNEEIGELTGIKPERVSELKRKLWRHIVKVSEKLIKNAPKEAEAP
ncbi:MAG: hypothetical protein KJ626_06855 [Verrucomicrobia bacterium]|nr:hypothetical protein [Verrucomicrobiota bacterium]